MSSASGTGTVASYYYYNSASTTSATSNIWCYPSLPSYPRNGKLMKNIADKIKQQLKGNKDGNR
jgi:hypothetical protein